jgi:hypothetical protein
MEGPRVQLQKTLALIKPDAVAAGRASEIMQIIELSGFTIIAKEHLQVRHAPVEGGRGGQDRGSCRRPGHSADQD